METHILDKRNLARAQVFVLVCLLIASGSIAMAPGVFASNQTPTAKAVTENIGDFTVTVTQSTMSQCYPGANVPVLQIDFTDNVGAGDVLDQLIVEYTGTDTADVMEATLWWDSDGNGLFNPANDFSLTIQPISGNQFIWNPAWAINVGAGNTASFWITMQTYTTAVIGHTVDGMVPAGGIILQTNGQNAAIMDPTDAPNFCTFVSNILPPQAVFGYLYQDDLVTAIPGVTVTLENMATGETIAMPTDGNGRYFFDLNILLLGFTDGDTVEVSTLAPNQAWNSGAIVIALPLLRLDLVVDTTDPATVLSIVPNYDNTGTWNVDFTWGDPLVNGYSSGVYSVEIYVETPATPGVFNLWTTQTDPAITGTAAYIPSAGEGVYYFYSVATDNAGNVETKLAAEDSIIYDLTAPGSTVTGPATSDVLVFDVAYNSADPGTAPSGVNYVSLWYSDDAGTTWTYFGDDAATGTFVGVTVPADGTYDWYSAAYDNAGNYEVNPVDATFIEFTTIVDTAAPLIGATTVAPLFITNNPLNPFGGTLPPAMVTTTVTDDNLGAAGWGIRNEFDWEGTIFFSCDITNEVMPATYGWDGSYYHIGGILVTAGISPFNAPLGDLFVFGEVNGASLPETEIGNTLPSHYATFQPDGTFQKVYETLGTIDYTDDNIVGVAGDQFRAYRYDEGAGYVATASVSIMPAVGDWVILDIDPVPDGRYTVGVSAIDLAGNTAWINETTNVGMVITVDNFAPDADATGPITSDAFAFDVTYAWTADPAPSSGFVNITLWYNRNSAGWMVYGNDIAVPDGTFPVDVTLIGGDGTYDWYMTAYDAANNHELPMLAIEATTLVDTLAPTIGATIVAPLYINNDPLNTFNGITPPAMVMTEVWDDNLAAAGWGIRNEFDWEGTIYFTCDITNEVMPATYGWDGSYYHIGGVLVTAGISPANAPLGDLFVFGEVNGASAPEAEIGNTLPSHYATFQPDGTFQAVYETLGTIDYLDDNAVGIAGDEFRAYRYDEGAGYIATASVSVKPALLTDPWVILDIDPVPDGRYTVGVSAIDLAGNTAWINETTTPNMVITVDNFAPDADATGPANSNVWIFDITYSWIADPAPSSGLLNVSLWYNLDTDVFGWIWFAEDPTPGDGLFPVDLTGLGDGTYEWFMAGFDMTFNHEDLLFVAEATTVVDNTDPYVVTTTPLNAAIDVALAAGTYVIEFSEPMDTLVGSVTTDLPGATPSWFDSDTLNIGYNLLSESTTYNIDLSVGGFQDVLGNPLAAGIYGWTFTFSSIGISPEVTTTVPLTGSTDIALAAGTYVIEFNEPMDTLVGAATTDLPGATPSWFDADTLYIDYTLLTESTIYNIDLSAGGFQDVYGNPLIAGTYGWTFTFETIHIYPEIAWTMPSDGDTGVMLNADVVIAFTETINIATITYSCAPDPGGWSETWSVGDTVLTLSHSDFSQFTSIMFAVTYAEDIYGNALVAGLVPNPWSFETIGSFNLNYNAGWNLFCIPVLNPTVGGAPIAAAADIGTAGAQMVSKWDYATQRYVNYIPGFHTPADPQNFAIVPDEAYWAWMPGAGTIIIDGENPGSRNLGVNGPGWNLVGYMDPVNLGDVETDWAPFVSCGAYDDIAYYDMGTFNHYIFPGTTMDLVPGRGYFVWSAGPATISYNAVAWNTNTGMGYPTIQAAIDSADPYDQIDVGPGTYYEQLVITKPMTLQGAGSGILSAGSINPMSVVSDDVSIISASGSGPKILGGSSWIGSAITILSDDVYIDGFELSNSANAGIYLYFAQNCEITNVKSTYNDKGFCLDNSHYNYFESTEAASNVGTGFFLSYSLYNTIYSSKAISNGYEGINLNADCDFNTVSSNILQYNGYEAITLYDDSNGNEISSNTVSNNYNDGIYLDSSLDNIIDSNTVLQNDGYGIVLSGCSNTNIAGNEVTYHNNWGISLQDSDSNTLSNNIASYNSIGLSMLDSTDNTVSGTTAQFNSFYGIFVQSSSNIHIMGSYVTDNAEKGIYVRGSTLISLDWNTVASSIDGIVLDGVTLSTISNNEIMMNFNYGIYLTYESSGITCGNIQITDNTVSNNMRGIGLNHAAGGVVVSWNNIANNMDVNIYVTFAFAQIYQNNFMGMPMGGHAYSSPGLPVFWDQGFPDSGNYWEGWLGGPYTISGGTGQTDNFPSMFMFP